MVIPAGFEPTACRLGGDRSILLSYGTSFSKVLILQDFRGSGDCSPWCLGVVFANQEGRFLIGFSNFGGRIFSHLLILTLRIRSVGLIPFPGRFRTLRPFSVSGKAVVGLFLRRRPLCPVELREHDSSPQRGEGTGSIIQGLSPIVNFISGCAARSRSFSGPCAGFFRR